MTDMDVSVEERLQDSSDDLAETSVIDISNPTEKVPTPALSPEKSLFGNSADRLRESDMETIITNGNTSSNGNETANGTHAESELPFPSHHNKDDSVEDKTDVSNDDSMDTSKEDPKDSESEKNKSDDSKITIEDKAGEDTCVRREFTPLTDKEDQKASAGQETSVDEVEMEVLPNPNEDESQMEVDVPAARRSTRRSNVTPAKPTKATPKATPRNAKKAKTTPAPEEQDDTVNEINEDVEKGEDQTAEESAETPANTSRRSLRAPKATPKEAPPSKAKTPASVKSKKKEPSEAEKSTKEDPPEAAEEEPTSSRRRSTRAAATVKKEVEKTPAKSIKKEGEPSVKATKGTKRSASKKVSEAENDETSDAEVKTPPAKRVKKEDTEKETETKATPRRASTRSKAAPKTPKSAAKRVKKESEKEEDVEMESEPEEKPSSAQKTPKRAPPKRSAATEKPGSSKTKTRQRRVSEPSDSLDPFNFDTKKDEHPEPFRGVHVEKKSFGNIKFFKQTKTDSESKYANMEKNATERRSLLPEPSPSSSKVKTPRTSSPKKAPASGQRSKGVKTKDASAESLTFEGEEKQESPKTKTPKSDLNAAVVKPAEVKEPAPILSAEEQILADDESNPHFPAGARVFGLWIKEYFSAVVGDVDGLGRYKVFYTEDQSTRQIPKAGVIPLHLVKEGCLVSCLGETEGEGERVVYEGKVLSIPSIQNAEEWHRGLYSVEVTNDEHPEPETREFDWFDIYFTESQYKQIVKGFKNPTFVDQNNVIDTGSRRPRRSTAAVATPVAVAKPKTPARKTTPKGKKAAAPNTEEVEESPKAEAAANNESHPSDNPEPVKIFEKMQFILTSANRHTGPPPFTKKEVKKQIESRGGSVIENFENMNLDPDVKTYLIADTYYRTHKYLTALSLSIPTVSFKWIEKCVEENKLVDSEDFMLDAGASENTGEVYKWKPLKDNLLVGKKISIYSDRQPTDSRAINFVQIWSPIVKNLGATLVEAPSDVAEASAFFKSKGIIDYLIADDGTNQEITNAVAEGGGLSFTSEFIIQTIITGSIAPHSGDEIYRLLPKP